MIPIIIVVLWLGSTPHPIDRCPAIEPGTHAVPTEHGAPRCVADKPTAGEVKP